jgi:predicted enzyme related to lactoylglutathione lyase
MGGPLHLSRYKDESPARMRDASAPEDSVISLHTDDVEGAYEEVQRLGYQIVYPMTTEPWMRRFFVRAPDGNVINIVRHRD